MSVRGLSFCLLVMAGAGSLSCAPALVMGQHPLKRATIELWRDRDNNCKTKTTPYIKVKKGVDAKVEWRIVDEVECTTNQDVIIKFDKTQSAAGCTINTDPLSNCTKQNKTKIECELETSYGRFCYNVYLGTTLVEDPELEIERP